MLKLIARLADMKIAIVLLVVLLVAMAAGTIVESGKGTDAAWKIVYFSWWFQLLLVAFGVNVLCSIVIHWPWGRWRIGFLLTHGALVVILAGAVVTEFFKIEGRLPIWEGDAADHFVREGRNEGEIVTLPFAIRLEAFEIDMYPGTRRPAMFRSRVVVEDRAGETSFPSVIQMNQELSYRGWKFFQSSYQQTPERDQTILAVSKDPGLWTVFVGYTLLLVGMCIVIGTRMLQTRATGGRVPLGSGPVAKRRTAAAAIALALLAATPCLAQSELPDQGTAQVLASLPIQHDGRAMPLDTLARESVWRVTGRHDWQGIEPTRLVLGWAFRPDAWSTQPLIPVGRDIARAIGLPDGTKRVSYADLMRNPRIGGILREAMEAERQERPLTPLQKKAEEIEGRITWLVGFMNRSSLAAIPHPTDPGRAWTVPETLRGPDDLKALLATPPRGAGYPTRTAVDREITYNRARPTRLAWWVLGAALVASALSMRRPNRVLDFLGFVGLVAGFAIMTWGIAVRWMVADRIPASNMFESLLFLAWGVGFFALVAFLVLRNRLVVLNALAMSALTSALTDLLPIDGFIHPVAPVLANTAWLAIHVPIIMLSYSVLALGVVVAHMQIGVQIFAPGKTDLVDRMTDLLYWYVIIGATLLVAGIITGSIWASFSWGRYWGWDPKEVWSLVAFFAYLAILHGRIQRFVGPFGVAAWSIAAFWTILMTYLGVNFVLSAGLHSYGFGSSSVVGWMALVAAAEVAFLAAGYAAYRARGLRGAGAR